LANATEITDLLHYAELYSNRLYPNARQVNIERRADKNTLHQRQIKASKQ